MDVKPRNGSIPDISLPEQQLEYWWEPGSSSSGSIEEERELSEYDCGYLDLGAETPNTSNFMQNPAPFQIPARRRSFRRASSPAATNRLSKYAVDRDCGICFEYAVLPCRTLCCGKIFCTEHLADWLHGPEAEGRCPNCENACSLEGGTLSLASPTELSSSQARRNNLAQARAQAIHSSSTPIHQPHSNDTLTTSRNESHPHVASTKLTSSSSTSSYSSSTVDYSETTVSAEESKMVEERHHIHHSFPNEEHLTDSSSPPWGVTSRLISIVLFLMFLYKLRS